MHVSRLLRSLSSRAWRRLPNSTPPRARLCPPLFRTYTKGANFGNQKLTNRIIEENESSHQQLGTYIIPSVLLVVAGAGLYVHYNDEKRAIPKGSQQNPTYGRSNSNRPAIGGPFKLYDTDNHLVTESSLQGNWIIMYFGYTSSPDVGPAEVKKMGEVVDILDNKYKFQIMPVYVTIDPQRDTPAQLKAYLKEFHPKIMGLTGHINAVRQAAQEYRVFFKKVDEEGQDYLVESSNNMYLLDPNVEMTRFFGVEYDASQLADAIIAEVNRVSS